MEQLDQIISVATRLFLHYGIRSVSMDDISKEAGISKKTLYQHVVDKKELVNICFERYIRSDEHACVEICDDINNPIEQLFTISSRMSNNMRSMNPALFIDLRKHYPEAWKQLEDHRRDFIYSKIRENLELGVEQGLYRADLNIEFVSRLYISLVGILLDHEVFPPAEFPFYQLTHDLFKYHQHAIVSEKGKAYLKKRTMDENKTQ